MRYVVFQCFYDYSISFFVLIIIRSYKVHLLSKTHLGTYCNFKFWICSNSFLASGHNRTGVTQNIKTLNIRKGQDAIIIRRRNLIHRIPCKNSRSWCIVLIVTSTNKKGVPLDVVHRWLINYYSKGVYSLGST